MNLQPSVLCAQVRAAIPLLAGDDLEPGALEAARRHLGACGSCARALEDARRARASLGILRQERPAPDLWDSVRRALRVEGLIHPPFPIPAQIPAPLHPSAAAPSGPLPRRRSRTPVRALAGTLAAAALVAATVWVTLQDDRSAGAPGSRPADLVSQADSGAPGSRAPSSQAESALPAPAFEAPFPLADPLGGGSGVRLVATRSSALGPAVVRTAAPPLAPAEADCADPWESAVGPQALRPSSDQLPRATVYYLPDGLSGEAIDVRQLRRHVHPLAGRPDMGVQAAGGRQ